MKAAVIGSPIAHSLSPLIFKFISHALGRDIDYQALEVKAFDGKSFLQSVKNEKDYLGLNVTLPLKELFLEEIDFLSPEVVALGALNVLSFNESGTSAFNTDIIGIQKTMEREKFSIEGKTCFLLGAGGAAKAVAYVLGTFKAKNVLIFNRSDKGEALARKFSLLFPDTHWHVVTPSSDNLKKHSIDLIINSTPLGMTGKESGEDFFRVLLKLKFKKEALAFDLIYTPERTDFLKLSKSLGLKTVGGLGMLIDQALATWKMWIGDLENEKELHQKLKDYLRGILKLRNNPSNLYLTGFMGAGKSSVGAELAALTGRTFLDTDKLIENVAELSIAEIFEIKGETFFRDLEQLTLLDLCASNNSVVSLGGGSLMNHDSLLAITKSGVLVYLAASKKSLMERIANQIEERPLLANLSPEEKVQKISKLLGGRIRTYQKARIHIDTDKLDPRALAYEICSAVGKLKDRN